MGDFVFKTKTADREVEIQIPIPGTSELDAIKKLVKPKKKEEEITVPSRRKKKAKNNGDGGRLSAFSALLASLVMIAMDE